MTLLDITGDMEYESQSTIDKGVVGNADAASLVKVVLDSSCVVVCMCPLPSTHLPLTSHLPSLTPPTIDVHPYRREGPKRGLLRCP